MCSNKHSIVDTVREIPAMLIILGPMIALAAVIILPIWSGATFGQKCAKLHQDGSPEWQQCIERLKHGSSCHDHEGQIEND